MKMPRPLTALRWIAALYVYVFGFGLLVEALWEIAHRGALVLEARPAEHLLGTWDTVGLTAWLFAVVYTGWRGMDREALS